MLQSRVMKTWPSRWSHKDNLPSHHISGTTSAVLLRKLPIALIKRAKLHIGGFFLMSLVGHITFDCAPGVTGGRLDFRRSLGSGSFPEQRLVNPVRNWEKEGGRGK